MKRKPIKKNEPILNREMKVIIFGVGLVRDVIIFGLFFYFFSIGTEISHLRTVFFVIIGSTSLASIFSLRDLNTPVWRLNPFSNLYLVGAVFISFLLLISAVYWVPLQKILSTVSLGFNSWILIFATGIINVIMVEVIKYHFILKQSRGAQ